MNQSSRFFENKQCEYYPCHNDIKEMNCLFCYCPLYERVHCPGNPQYLERNGNIIKSCMDCTFPHEPENYDTVMQFLKIGPEKQVQKEVAVLADIHSNHVALERCVSHARERGIKTFIFLGDFVSDCPYPQKTMKFLYELAEQYECFFVRGNREEYILDYDKSEEKKWMPGSASGSLLYSYENLAEKDLAFFDKLKQETVVSFPGCPSLTICHGSPRKSNELLYEDAKNTREILEGLDTNYLLCAHSHIQYAWEYQGKYVINPGSVGVPEYYDGKAQYAILRGNTKGWQVEFFRLTYDIEQVMWEFLESGLKEMAPHWSRMTREMMHTGVNKMSKVVDRVAEMCADKYEWPNYPEEYFEMAIAEIWPEIKEK